MYLYMFHNYEYRCNWPYVIFITDIVEDSKQQLYTSCCYTGPNGMTCNNPVPKYLEPLLCGGHWDQGEVVIPSDTDSDSDHDDNDNDERKDDDDDVKVKNEN